MSAFIMGLLGGLVGKLIGLTILLVLLVGVTGGFLYATDFGIEATVVDVDRASLGASTCTVHIVTKIGAIPKAVDVEGQAQCAAVNEDNFVRYHIQSERTIIWDREGGRCIWDTETGPGCAGGSDDPDGSPGFPLVGLK